MGEFDQKFHLYFGQVQRLMFVGVKFGSSSNVKVQGCKFFKSNSNRFSVILIWSSELASLFVSMKLSKLIANYHLIKSNYFIPINHELILDLTNKRLNSTCKVLIGSMEMYISTFLCS